MGEMATAMRSLGKIDRAHLIENNGKWFFVGRVDSRLCVTMPDGSTVPDNIMRERRNMGMPALVDKKYGVRRLTWETQREAIDYACALGISIA